jgi:hypothetical protein
VERQGDIMPHPKGGYKVNGERVPGSTTIESRFEDKSALIGWAFKQGQKFERGEISGLYRERDKAGEIGTMAHELFEQWLNGETINDDWVLSAVDERVWTAFVNAKEWFDGTRIKIVSQEVEMVSEKYKFGGCLDAIGIDHKGRYTLLDWKTSNKGPFVGWLCQIASYGYLWNYHNPDKRITGGYHVGKFSKEFGDFSHFYWSELDDAWEQFKLFRQAYEIDRRLKKRV